MLESRLPERPVVASCRARPTLEQLTAQADPGRGRWRDFHVPSSLQLAPLLDLLLLPIDGNSLQGRVRLGLQEALVNAVCHGNGRDPSLFLRIRRIECERWWVFQVQDQGQGVPPARRRPCLPSDPCACAGRGLFLIHQCFDDVRWSRRGNRLQLAAWRQRP